MHACRVFLISRINAWSRYCLVAAYSVPVFATPTNSIRDVDFKNFSYPFIESEGVPADVRWMPTEVGTAKIRLA